MWNDDDDFEDDWEDEDDDFDDWDEDEDLMDDDNLTDETTNQQKGNNAMSNLPTNRTHQTAVVINVRDGVRDQYRNRFQRLLQSVGNQNIKVDVFTLKNGGGASLVAGAPDDTSAATDTSDVDVKAWAKDLGFNMLIEVSDPKA